MSAGDQRAGEIDGRIFAISRLCDLYEEAERLYALNEKILKEYFELRDPRKRRKMSFRAIDSLRAAENRLFRDKLRILKAIAALSRQ